MKYIDATIIDCNKIYILIQETIKTIYPKYYPREVVDFFSELHNIDKIKQDIDNKAVGILVDGDILVGTGTFKENHITRVFVSPKYQQKGYGSYIMQQLENKISTKYNKVYLDASLSAVLFYEKRKYITIRHETWNCKNDVVLVYDIMEKLIRKTTKINDSNKYL